jgi:hypothetical protein
VAGLSGERDRGEQSDRDEGARERAGTGGHGALLRQGRLVGAIDPGPTECPVGIAAASVAGGD